MCVWLASSRDDHAIELIHFWISALQERIRFSGLSLYIDLGLHRSMTFNFRKIVVLNRLELGFAVKLNVLATLHDEKG